VTAVDPELKLHCQAEAFASSMCRAGFEMRSAAAETKCGAALGPTSLKAYYDACAARQRAKRGWFGGPSEDAVAAHCLGELRAFGECAGLSDNSGGEV